MLLLSNGKPTLVQSRLAIASVIAMTPLSFILQCKMQIPNRISSVITALRTLATLSATTQQNYPTTVAHFCLTKTKSFLTES